MSDESSMSISAGAEAIAKMMAGTGLPSEPEQATEPEATAAQSPSESTSEPEQESQQETSEQDETDETDEADEKPKYKVIVDGQESEVTIDELLKGFQTERSVTKRSQELAEQRKAFEAEQKQTREFRQALAAERQQNMQAMQYVMAQLQAQVPKEPDWAKLAQEDPVGAFQQRMAFEQQQRQMFALRQQQQLMQQNAEAEEYAQYEETKAANAKRLAELIPDYGKPEKKGEVKKTIRSQLNAEGFSDEEIKTFAIDSRALNMAWKCAQFDKLMAQRATITPKVERVAQPGQQTKPPNQAHQLARKFGQTHSIGDAAALLKARGLI